VKYVALCDDEPHLFFKRLDVIKCKKVVFIDSVILSRGVEENFVAAIRSDQLAPLRLLCGKIIML
jgi:hypothetical protein